MREAQRNPLMREVYRDDFVIIFVVGRYSESQQRSSSRAEHVVANAVLVSFDFVCYTDSCAT